LTLKSTIGLLVTLFSALIFWSVGKQFVMRNRLDRLKAREQTTASLAWFC